MAATLNRILAKVEQLGENYFVAERIEDRWVVFPWDNF